MNLGLKEKLCFLGSATCIVTSVYYYAVQPSIILYLFSVIFILSMVARVVNYWHSKYLLFMLDLCYAINTLSLIMVWGFPTCLELRYVQFGLANTHAYWGSFLYRNALVLHDFQKLVSTFIHILPVLFSFLLRWYPKETSVFWYTSFTDTKAKAEWGTWMDDQNWFYQFLVPLLIFITREILYYLIIYGCVKPGEEHLDSYRYMRTRKFLAVLFWDRFDSRWHLLIWIVTGIVISALSLCVAVISWSNYLCHCIMLVLQLLVVCWNGASYYIDYYPLERQRQSKSRRPVSGTADRQLHSDPSAAMLLPGRPNGKPSLILDVSAGPMEGDDDDDAGSLTVTVRPDELPPIPINSNGTNHSGPV